MDCSTPGFPVLHYLSEFAQTHVCRVGDAILPSHPLSAPSPPAPNLSQHQGFFPTSWLFTSGGRSSGASASACVLPMNIQGWFCLGLTGLISLLSKGLSSLLQYYSLKASILRHSALFIVWLSHPYMTTGKTIALARWTFVSKVMSLHFICCVCHSSSSKEQASFNFVAAVTIFSDFGAQEKKVCHCVHCSSFCLP